MPWIADDHHAGFSTVEPWLPIGHDHYALAVDRQEGDEESHKSSGTGEQYVKSSGLQADGGDFDATNPGAGREADRKSN